MVLKPKMSPPEIDRTKKKNIKKVVEATPFGVSKTFMNKVATIVAEGTAKDKSKLIQFVDKLKTKVTKD